MVRGRVRERGGHGRGKSAKNKHKAWKACVRQRGWASKIQRINHICWAGRPGVQAQAGRSSAGSSACKEGGRQ